MNVNQWGSVNQWGGESPSVATLAGTITMPSMQADGSLSVEQLGSVTVSGSVIMPSMLAVGNLSATSPDPELTGVITMPSMSVSGSIQGPLIRLKARKVIRVY